VRLTSLFYFYRRRLRRSAVQELLAGVGIAIGVALVLAVQVANSSITAASSAIVRGIAGTATLQVRSRDSNGFNEALLIQVHHLPGVARAAPILEQDATLVGIKGRSVAVDLASSAPALLRLDGDIVRNISVHDLTAPGVMLPTATAAALGISPAVFQQSEGAAPRVTLDIHGYARSVPVLAVLGPESIGALSSAMAAISPLWWEQKITGRASIDTRILVKSKPGQQALVLGELNRLAGGRLNVGPADQDVSLLKQAVIPNAEATGFFALVSAIVGFLLAFSAMLLTVPERRRMIADLRIQGVGRLQLVKMLMFQAVCLGVMASVVGVGAGIVLSRTIFHTTPGYLASAFPLGAQTVVGVVPVLIAFGGGVLATCIAACPPLLDLRRSAVDAVYTEEGEPGQALDRHEQLRLFAYGVLLMAATNGLLIFWRSGVIVATIGLAIGTLLAIPLAFRAALWLAERTAALTPRLNMLTVAVRTLRRSTVRSLALAATGAIAVFGCVIAEDSHQDLLHGLYGDYSEYVSTSNLWVVNNHDDLATISFPSSHLQTQIARVPGVAEVRPYQGGFLDFDGRRVWVLARSPKAHGMIPTAQVEEGSTFDPETHLREGGWITVSQQVAEAHHVIPGDTLTLPTPSGPVAYRVAATTTNLGWTSGAIILNSSDYSKAWGTSDTSALEIDTRPGANLATVKHSVHAALGSQDALKVQTSNERATQANALARQGLSRTNQISLLLIVAAALAMAAAMGAGIWQRRAALASLRIQSYTPWQLRTILAYESTIVLGTGAVGGALAGVYGHLLSDRFLRLTTGFPAPFAWGGAQTIRTILIILLAALLALAGLGYAASNVAPELALEP
jgi:putative ABC transport system permease protein